MFFGDDTKLVAGLKEQLTSGLMVEFERMCGKRKLKVNVTKNVEIFEKWNGL